MYMLCDFINAQNNKAHFSMFYTLITQPIRACEKSKLFHKRLKMAIGALRLLLFQCLVNVFDT